MRLEKLVALGSLVFGANVGQIAVVQAQQPLSVVYPPIGHQTTSAKIFLIGTSEVEGQVTVNGELIKRSPQGHFAPSFPLNLGENSFILRQNNQEIAIKVTRISNQPTVPKQLGFTPDSLVPQVNISRLVGETICFQAVALPQAEVTVNLLGKQIPLLPANESVGLPANSAVLVGANQPITTATVGKYQGCQQFSRPGNYGKPTFIASLAGEQVTEVGLGEIKILNPGDLAAIEVTADQGVARTGASTNYSRLTPLPQGTRARVTGQEGDWLRLDYGGWLKTSETRVLVPSSQTNSIIRSITSQQLERETKIIFPLEVAVPVSIQQGSDSITLRLHNTIAQTDTIRLDNDPLIERLDWQQSDRNTIDYTFHLKTDQQWGYDLRYEGTSLILSLRHPPKLSINRALPLQGISLVLDPGHGGTELGAKAPTGYPEKTINLLIAKLLKQELNKLGATVHLTRDSDLTLSLRERMNRIQELKPDLALSIHYNALPDNGDAENTQGISMFWYHPQSHSLAVALHDHLVSSLDRTPAGVFWNNLALTRPQIAPMVLLELGFMINPWEFEWISDRTEQEKLVNAIAQGIINWLQQQN